MLFAFDARDSPRGAAPQLRPEALNALKLPITVTVRVSGSPGWRSTLFSPTRTAFLTRALARRACSASSRSRFPGNAWAGACRPGGACTCACERRRTERADAPALTATPQRARRCSNRPRLPGGVAFGRRWRGACCGARCSPRPPRAHFASALSLQVDPAKAAAAKEDKKRKAVEDGEKAWLVRACVALCSRGAPCAHTLVS